MLPRPRSNLRSLGASVGVPALAGAVLFCAAALQMVGAEGQPPISFVKQIAPIVVGKCQTCHNNEKAKGGYRLETFQTLMKPGDSKESPVVAGQPTQSKLYELITAADPDDRMPQKADPLPAGQIALIEKWIAEGAVFDGTNRSTPLAVFASSAVRVETPSAYPQPVPILALAFNPATEELAASGYGEVTLWQHGKLIRRIGQLPQKIQALAFSRDGAILAVGGGYPGISGETILIRTGSGAERRALGTFSDVVLDVQFAPDDKRLATGGADNSIRLYDVASGRQQLLIQQHADWVTSVAFSHDGKRIASASRDRTCRIFDADTGELETTYMGHEAPVLSVAFSADDTFACSAGRDKKIHFWQIKEGKKSNELATDGEVLRLASISNRVFSCGSEKIVREYDADQKKERRQYVGHKDWVYSLAIDTAHKRLATGAFDGDVRLWNLETGELIEQFVAAPGFVREQAGR